MQKGHWRTAAALLLQDGKKKGVELQQFATHSSPLHCMPIASKLLYFQRRASPASAPDPGPDPPDPRRRLCRRGAAASGRPRRRSSLSHHHHHDKPADPELVPGYQRDGAKFVGSAGGNLIEHTGSTGSSLRYNRSVSDHERLPDDVRQARERLLQRLNSVNLSGRRQNTPSSETIWAAVTHPADHGVSISTVSILGSLTSGFRSSVSIADCKVQEISAEPLIITDTLIPITPCSLPTRKLQELTNEEANEGESTAPSSECSICLERCGDAEGLIRLRCKHVFHSACLERWLRSRGDCPYCRASVLLTSDTQRAN